MWKPRPAALLGLLVLTSLMPVGCARPRATAADSEVSPRIQNLRDRFTEDTRSRKAGSLESWRERRISGMDAPSHAAVHTALLLPASVRVSQQRRKAGASVVVTMKISGSGRFYAGSAVPVARGGYFLTASHCLDEGSATLFAVTPEKMFRSAAVRVVWKGLESQGEPDLALIHAPLEVYGTLALVDFNDPVEGRQVLLAGFGTEASTLKLGHGGGKVVNAGGEQTHPSGARWRKVYHTAPFAPGDSGGLLIDSQGSLLGINVEYSTGISRLTGKPRASSYKCVAVLPDRQWIRALIEKDRRAPR